MPMRSTKPGPVGGRVHQLHEQLEMQISDMVERLENLLARSGALTAKHRAILDEAQELINSIHAATERLQRSVAH